MVKPLIRKQYGSGEAYERKLVKIMERLGVDTYNFNWDRWGCFVEFRYKGELYRIDHSIENAKARGITLHYGSDSFAQVVLALEDLAGIVERGIYELSTWVAGMKYLAPPNVVPHCFEFLGFKRIPAGVGEIKERYQQLTKRYHTSLGGDEEYFRRLQIETEKALKYFDQPPEPS